MDNKDLPAMPQTIAINSIDNVYSSFDDSDQHGLSKREYFAGLAMQSLIQAHKNTLVSVELIAECSIEQADALLDSLQEKQGDE